MARVGRGALPDFFFEVGISFDLTVGEPPPPVPLEPIDPLEMLVEALERRESWSAQTPQLGERPIVKLRPIEPGDTEIVVHPLGSLTVRQRVLPLDLTIEQFGHLPLAEGARSSYTIKGATVGDQPAPTMSEVRDHFAPGEFFALTEEEKLTRPAFEPLQAGASLGGRRHDARRAGAGEHGIPRADRRRPGAAGAGEPDAAPSVPGRLHARSRTAGPRRARRCARPATPGSRTSARSWVWTTRRTPSRAGRRWPPRRARPRTRRSRRPRRHGSRSRTPTRSR